MASRRALRLAVALVILAVGAGCTNSGGTASRSGSATAATVRAAAPTTSTTPVSPTAPSTGADGPVTAAAAAAAGLPVLPDLSAPDESPSTLTEALQTTIGQTGTPTLPQALDIFSVSMAALPGAPTSTLPAGQGFSATVANGVIAPYRNQLTPAQRAIVDSFDGTVIATTAGGGHHLVPVTTAPTPSPGSAPSTTPSTASATTPTPGSTSTATTTTATAAWVPPNIGPAPAEPANFSVGGAARPSTAALAHDTDLMNTTLNGWVAYQPVLFARPTGYTLAVSNSEPTNNAEMDTRPSPYIPGGCLITMYPTFTGGHYSDPLAKNVFAHELFHCIQQSWVPPSNGREWLIEGSAEWAALDLYRGSFQPVDGESWEGWFRNTGLALGVEKQGTGYDDWPLFEAFRQTYSTDPYPNIEAMIESTATTTAGILHAGNFDNPIFANLWTSTSLRSTTFNDADFTLNWPGVDPGYGSFKDTAVALGSQGVGTFKVKGKGNFTHQQYQVGFSGDVGVVAVTPNGSSLLTHADAGAVSVGLGLQKWFCVDPGKCQCPSGSHPTRTLTPLTPPMIFSFATQQAASSASVVDQRWDPKADCTPDSQDDPGSNGTSGPVGTSNGDPHITTFNGLTYDFMTYGEFVTARDGQGGFTVQERHLQAGFGTAISAVAIGDGTHRVTLTATAITPTAPVTVRVDGVATSTLPASAGGLHVAAGDRVGSWIVSLADGTAVQAFWNDGLFLTVQPSAARAAHIVGLLGTPGSDVLHDLAMPDGSRALPDNNYQAYAQAWWVTDATSLFDYDTGQNTETFRVALPAPPLIEPSAVTITACQQGLGAAATTSEVSACAYDLTSFAQAPADRASIVAGYQQVTAARSAQISEAPSVPSAPRITVGHASPLVPGGAPASAPSSSGGGGSTLTLRGTLGTLSDSSVQGSLTGTMQLSAGTVLLARTQCPSDPDFTLSVRATTTAGSTTGLGFSTSTGLCGSLWSDDTYDAVPARSEIHQGEGYILINQTGSYTIAAVDGSIYSGSPGATTVSVSLFSDPTPTVVPPTGLPAAGVTRTFSSTGATMILEVVTGTTGGTWSIGGGDKACAQVYYISGPLDTDKSPSDLGGVCWHHTQLSIGPSNTPIPIIVFDRDGSPVTVTVTRTQ